MSVFIIEHVYKSFKVDKNETKVLKDINISFPETGLVSIVGKSGSGKSTLLNVMMGIEKPTKGRVLFLNKNICNFTDKQFSKYHLDGVSLIFQHYNLFDNLSALENAILPLQMKGFGYFKAKEKALVLFKKFNIEYLAFRNAASLSGGEKQRVAIIRSLLVEPRAILCDEPTGALDSKNSIEILNILKEISQNTLVVLVSHNMRLVKKYSDEIIYLKDGEINEIISINKIKHSLNKSKSKIHYKHNWIRRIFRKKFFKNIGKNLFTLIVTTISFIIVLLSVGFIAGSETSQNSAIDKNLSKYFSTVSNTEFIDIKDSPLTYEKTIRPTYEEIDEKFAEFKCLRIEENISYFISDFSSCIYDGKNILNYQMVPLYDNEKIDSKLFIEGSNEINGFEDIIINTEFAKLLDKKDVIDSEIIITSSSPVSYSTGIKENPFIKDTFDYTKKFRIVGVVEEFAFLNTPKIYYSYYEAKTFLKNQRMLNLSEFFGKSYSYLDYLLDSKNDDPVSSYSYFLFISDDSELDNFYKRISELSLLEDNIQVTSSALEIKNAYSTFINSFSSSLVVFIIIAFLGLNLILGMMSLSTFIEDKKQTAILTCLGARNQSIYKLYLSENYLVIILSLFVAFLSSFYLQNYLNVLLSKSFHLTDLISIPFSSLFGIKYLLIISFFLMSIIFASLFTLIPIIIYRRKSITDELRDE